MRQSRAFLRLMIIGFFLGLNLVLGAYFAQEMYGIELPYTKYVATLAPSGLQSFSNTSQFRNLLQSSNPIVSDRIDLRSDAILEAINAIRSNQQVAELQSSSSLQGAAEAIADWIEAEGQQFSQDALQSRSQTQLQQAGYDYERALQHVVLGPYTIKGLQNYWASDDSQKMLIDNQVREAGIATRIINTNGVIEGISVIVLAQPQTVPLAAPQNPPPSSKPAIPPIPDDEVIAALNQYRATHGRGALSVNEHLCAYAEKRVQDLVKYGGLDNHEGFRADFADQEALPEPIQNYSGTQIGENLAHQLCRNMQTGEGFVATSGTALIEWCFDSSTKGHREAQLSTQFQHVCVRHADAMYVVIFGN